MNCIFFLHWEDEITTHETSWKSLVLNLYLRKNKWKSEQVPRGQFRAQLEANRGEMMQGVQMLIVTWFWARSRHHVTNKCRLGRIMSSLPFHMTTLPLPCITVSTPRRHTRIYYFDVTKHVLSSRYFYRNSDSPYHVTSAHHCMYSCIIIVLSDISCINLQFIARHLRRILLRGFRFKTNFKIVWKKLQINKSIIGFILYFFIV